MFSSLPEECIFHILSFTSPRDTCSLAAVSSLFRSSTQSDHVWDRFLQRGCSDILQRSDGPSSSSSWKDFQHKDVVSSKKELFFLLCSDPVLIDSGTMAFSMDKMAGKRCYMLSPKKLDIDYRPIPLICRWDSVCGSRFPEVLLLARVDWLEFNGQIDASMLSSKTTYKAYLVFKFLGGGHKFDFLRAEVSVKMGSHRSKKCSLFERCEDASCCLPLAWHEWVLQDRSDEWVEVEIGEFFIDQGVEGEVVLRLRMAKRCCLVTVITIEGIEIRPLH